MNYYHLDVFADQPFSGNGLTVFMDTEGFSKSFMQTLTREMRQFESIFLSRTGEKEFRAHIFTMEEELDFAGHPVIGAAALLHDLYSKNRPSDRWTIQLNHKAVEVNTGTGDGFYSAKMNQGRAVFSDLPAPDLATDFLRYLNLREEDRAGNLPLQVVSTGLPYLLLPVRAAALGRVKVVIPDLEEKLASVQAKFFYAFDPEGRRGRTWDNLGAVEDIATGSAAGPVGAYLVRHGLARTDEVISLRQGEFLQRPSELKIIVESAGDIHVEGNVCMIAAGRLLQRSV